MPTAPRFQFSLAALFVALTAVSLGTAVIVARYQAQDRRERTVLKTGEIVSHFDYPTSGVDSIQIENSKDHCDRPVGYVFLLFDACGPAPPALRQSFQYERRRGGTLKIDGQRVDPADGPALFVNGPYGHTVRLAASEEDFIALDRLRGAKPAQCIAVWRERIEPRLYKLSGDTVNDQRQGRWVYRLANDALYLETEYQGGLRHGSWTTYFPNGTVLCRAQFEANAPSGHWEFFDQSGKLLGSLDFEQGKLKDLTMMHGEGRTGSWLAERNGQVGLLMTRESGGKFFIDGQQLIRPTIDFPLQIYAQPPGAIESSGK